MTILHIEADAGLQHVIGYAVARHGYNVTLAPTFDAAAAAIDSPTPYHLILLGTLSSPLRYNPNVASPEVSLVKRACALPHRFATPIIISASTQWLEDALAAGASDSFRMPADTPDITATLARYLPPPG